MQSILSFLYADRLSAGSQNDKIMTVVVFQSCLISPSYRKLNSEHEMDTLFMDKSNF